jgi:hypothetical protein
MAGTSNSKPKREPGNSITPIEGQNQNSGFKSPCIENKHGNQFSAGGSAVVSVMAFSATCENDPSGLHLHCQRRQEAHLYPARVLD